MHIPISSLHASSELAGPMKTFILHPASTASSGFDRTNTVSSGIVHAFFVLIDSTSCLLLIDFHAAPAEND